MESSLPCPTRSGARCRLAALFMAGLLAGGLSPFAAQAQDLTLPEETYVNRYAPPGASTIQVYIWGSVGTTGIWRIEPDLDLVELLSVAGVTGIGTDEPEIRQRVNLRIYREGAAGRRMIYEERLDEVLAEGASYPLLESRDVLEVEVERRRGISFALVSQIMGTASSLTLLILRLTSGR